jgi:hypothetical protein
MEIVTSIPNSRFQSFVIEVIGEHYSTEDFENFLKKLIRHYKDWEGADMLFLSEYVNKFVKRETE